MPEDVGAVEHDREHVGPLLTVWVLLVLTTGYVGLATMCAALSAPLYVAVTGLPERVHLLVFTAALALFIVFTHRANIKRMLQGNENRMSRRLFSRSRG